MSFLFCHNLHKSLLEFSSNSLCPSSRRHTVLSTTQQSSSSSSQTHPHFAATCVLRWPFHSPDSNKNKNEPSPPALCKSRQHIRAHRHHLPFTFVFGFPLHTCVYFFFHFRRCWNCCCCCFQLCFYFPSLSLLHSFPDQRLRVEKRFPKDSRKYFTRFQLCCFCRYIFYHNALIHMCIQFSLTSDAQIMQKVLR